jgi:hypothetical protein
MRTKKSLKHFPRFRIFLLKNNSRIFALPEAQPELCPSRSVFGDAAVFPSPMKTPGSGAAEVWIYWRPSNGAALVNLSLLELAAPPRVVVVGGRLDR